METVPAQKWLIYGHRGWIGQQVCQLLESRPELTPNTVSVIRGQARCDDLAAVRAELISTAPDRVILLIGRTHGTTSDGKQWSTIDYLEQPGKLRENVRDNLFSPLAIALLCNSLNGGIHLTYLGTGCIFEFDSEHPFGQEVNGFTESSDPNFFGSSYSIVKGFTDRTMRLLSDDLGMRVLNLRIRMPITGSPNPRNFITKITNYARICSVPNSMTVLDELLPAAIQMIARDVCGTVNLTNPGLISHDEMLAMYREIVDPGFKWVNMSIEEQSAVLASGRSNNYLDTTRLETLCRDGLVTVPVRPIKEAVCLAMLAYRDAMPRIRVLVTGGCGFIGSNFINYIIPKNPQIDITNLDALYYCASESNVSESIRTDTRRYKFEHVNLKDIDAVRRVVDSVLPHYIIHFAAQSHVDNSFANSIQFTMDNIVGTHNLLECVRTSSARDQLRKFIHVSTDEVYGESMLSQEEQHKTEHSVLCPTNPYAATKAGAELLAASYRHSFGLPIIVTRGNNVYGLNQYPEKLVPRFINQLKAGERLTVAGLGNQLRSFLHVWDTARAFECIMFKGVVGEIYNIGTHEELSVMDVARRCVALWHGIPLAELEADPCQMEKYITYVPDRPFNDMRYFISNDKLRALGWDIKYTFMDGLDELIHPKS